MLYQPVLPPQYALYNPADLADQVQALRQRLGRRLVILGHHYQQDEVIRFADHTGDSLKLSQIAARQRDAEFVVFCGVHFMAETADLLTADHVQVLLPDLSAGCSMADMAAIEDVEAAWEFLAGSTPEKIIPITYVNSTADVKAFCGQHDGACCTSSNARQVLEWALRAGGKVIFLPDQHLGRNTAYVLGHALDSMVVYDPHEPDGGLTPAQVRAARFILWRGHCSVHQLFTPAQCAAVRCQDSERRIIVHPECQWEVVQQADLAGSTEYIIRTITDAAPGSKWAVGTEANLVNRLAREHADQDIRSLAGIQCLCTTMYRISPRHLLWCLDELAAGRVVNRIQVAPQVRHWANVALQRMLENVAAGPVGLVRTVD